MLYYCVIKRKSGPQHAMEQQVTDNCPEQQNISIVRLISQQAKLKPAFKWATDMKRQLCDSTCQWVLM